MTNETSSCSSVSSRFPVGRIAGNRIRGGGAEARVRGEKEPLEFPAPPHDREMGCERAKKNPREVSGVRWSGKSYLNRIEPN
jgi:hypothetical protein